MTNRIDANINTTLRDLRDYRQMLMDLPDNEEGRSHSHGETDNTRGLRIRAISLAITNLETAGKFYTDAKDENLEEYQV